MILIDTKGISVLMHLRSAPQVLAWFGGKNASALYLSAVDDAELRQGAMFLPKVSDVTACSRRLTP